VGWKLFTRSMIPPQVHRIPSPLMYRKRIPCPTAEIPRAVAPVAPRRDLMLSQFQIRVNTLTKIRTERNVVILIPYRRYVWIIGSRLSGCPDCYL
jgi:hypothetical protein